MKTVINWVLGATGVGAAVAVCMALIFMETINPNEVGVFQYRPYFIGADKIDPKIITGPARAYMWPSTKLWEINTAHQTLTVHAADFMTADRVPLDFDVSITIRITEPQKAPEMIQRFGSGPVNTFRTLVLQDHGDGRDIMRVKAPSGEFMSYLRDQVRSHHSAVFIAAQEEDGRPSNGAATVEQQTRDHINQFLTRNGAGLIQVENIALGKANPPEGVRRTIERTAEQAQEVKTQKERKRAAEARREAETASANADLAYLNTMAFTPDQFIELQRLKVFSETCKTNTCVFTTGQVPLALPTPNTRVQQAAGPR